MLPVEGCDTIGIRPVIAADEARGVLETFAKLEIDPVQNWNRRYRENMLRLKSGKLDEVSRVVKSLMVRESEHGLSTGERKMLSTAKQILLSELVLATNETYETLERALAACLLVLKRHPAAYQYGGGLSRFAAPGARLTGGLFAEAFYEHQKVG